jgi:hypothetical protein
MSRMTSSRRFLSSASPTVIPGTMTSRYSPLWTTPFLRRREFARDDENNHPT